MRRRLVLGAVLAAAMLVVGCGDDSSSPDATDPAPGDDVTTDGTDEPGGTTTTTAPPAPPTVDELLAGDEVLNIAHAGGDQDHPHSTMYAFSEAVAAGADVLEFDIWATADGVVVIHHDADTQKTAEESLVVAETDLATLQELDNAYWFSPECWPCHDRPVEEYVFRGVRTGERPPPDGYTAEDFRIATVEELDERFPDVPFDIEIKGEGEVGIRNAEALAETLDRLGRNRSTVVVSFDSDVVAGFHDVAPDVVTSPGVAELTEWLLNDVPLAPHHRVIQVPPFFEGVEVLTPDSVAKAHDDGLEVWVWMDSPREQENAEFYRSLVELGVDGLIVGRPAAAEPAIGA